jgi:hypothetical protein
VPFLLGSTHVPGFFYILARERRTWEERNYVTDNFTARRIGARNGNNSRGTILTLGHKINTKVIEKTR